MPCVVDGSTPGAGGGCRRRRVAPVSRAGDLEAVDGRRDLARIDLVVVVQVGPAGVEASGPGRAGQDGSAADRRARRRTVTCLVVPSSVWLSPSGNRATGSSHVVWQLDRLLCAPSCIRAWTRREFGFKPGHRVASTTILPGKAIAAACEERGQLADDQTGCADNVPMFFGVDQSCVLPYLKTTDPKPMCCAIA